MTHELKPCPFCGTTPIVKHLYLAGEPTHSIVECPHCHVKTDFYIYEYGERNVAEVWNRRVTEYRKPKTLSQLEAENAELRELCKTLYQLADESYVPFKSANRWMDDFAKAICAMRELGIEVEGWPR